jgi:succinate dehydrogenase / fumarate reductase cytochrome b subunit
MKLLQLQKRAMALAGTIMTVYLLFHMLSNLSFFFRLGV